GRSHVTPDANPFGWSWTQARATIPNVLRLTPTWGWPRPEYYPFAGTFEHAPLAVLAFIPALASAAALPLARGRLRPLALVTIVSAGAVVVLTKGLHRPLASLNTALYSYVPGMWLFREPATKFTPLLAGIFAIGIAVLVSSVGQARLRHAVVGVLGASIA